MKQLLTGVILLITLLSCGKNRSTLNGIDLQAWQSDKDGCNGFRTQTIDTLQTQTNSLLGLKEMDIVDLLGVPDQNELYKRNQKFYTYFLHPAPTCPSPDSTPLKLIIRFNAMGLAKEVSTE